MPTKRTKVVERKTPADRTGTDITLRTRTPGKWLFVDQETGEAWEHTGDKFTPANVSVLVLPRLPRPA